MTRRFWLVSSLAFVVITNIHVDDDSQFLRRVSKLKENGEDVHPIASHVLDFAGANKSANQALWYPDPSYIANVSAMESLLFPDSTPRRIQVTQSSVNVNTDAGKNPRTLPKPAIDQYVGFIRITKTGSTSLFNLLQASSKAHPFINYIDFPKYAQEKMKLNTPGNPNPEWREALKKKSGNENACIFGRGPLPLGQEIDKPGPSWQCAHSSYNNIVSHWATSLPYYDFTAATTTHHYEAAALDMVTIFRDPTERFLSYFNYWRQIYPRWNGTVRYEPERAALIDGDAPEYIKAISESHPTKERSVNSFFQYQYLNSHNLTKAIDMISSTTNDNRLHNQQQQQRRVFPMINECFDASGLLLSELYPDLFSMNDTRTFLSQPEIAHGNKSKQKWNANSNSNTTAQVPRTQLKNGLWPVKDNYDLEDLKQRARREWLVDDYKLYHKAVWEFRTMLHSSKLYRGEGQDEEVRQILQNCTYKLDKILQDAVDDRVVEER